MPQIVCASWFALQRENNRQMPEAKRSHRPLVSFQNSLSLDTNITEGTVKNHIELAARLRRRRTVLGEELPHCLVQ